MQSSSNTKVYVGNLSWATTDDGLRETFSAFGQIFDSIVMRDRDTGKSRGFGFVTYGSPQEANEAIRNLNGSDLDGRQIKVNLANARPSGGGGFSQNAGGGYGGGSGYPQQGGSGGYGGGYMQQGYGGYGGQQYPSNYGGYGGQFGQPPYQGGGGGPGY